MQFYMCAIHAILWFQNVMALRGHLLYFTFIILYNKGICTSLLSLFALFCILEIHVCAIRAILHFWNVIALRFLRSISCLLYGISKSMLFVLFCFFRNTILYVCNLCYFAFLKCYGHLLYFTFIIFHIEICNSVVFAPICIFEKHNFIYVLFTLFCSFEMLWC